MRRSPLVCPAGFLGICHKTAWIILGPRVVWTGRIHNPRLADDEEWLVWSLSTVPSLAPYRPFFLMGNARARTAQLGGISVKRSSPHPFCIMARVWNGGRSLRFVYTLRLCSGNLPVGQLFVGLKGKKISRNDDGVHFDDDVFFFLFPTTKKLSASSLTRAARVEYQTPSIVYLSDGLGVLFIFILFYSFNLCILYFMLF